MKLVVDTNILIALALGEPERHDILRLTVGSEIYAPDVLPFEIGNALSALLKKRLLNPSQILEAWDNIQKVPVELRRINIRSALEIATQFKIYAYDAYFLECANSLGCSLLTLDQKLQSHAKQMRIQLIEVKKR